MIFDKRNKAKHINKLQEALPYETPLNVRQVANLPYGDGDLMADYYEPMALTRSEAPADKRSLRVAILLHDDPVAGGRADVMHLAMEFARRGLAVYSLGLSHGNKDGTPFFLENIDNLFAFLADFAVDKHRLGLRPCTFATPGNKVILMGCGTGATLAGVALRLMYNARMREYFAARCPHVHAYFGLGDTPAVNLNNLIRLEAFVSMSGQLSPVLHGDARSLEPWCGVGFARTILADYLDFARYPDPAYPPMLLVTSAADTTRRQALAVSSLLPSSRCRLLDQPEVDAEGHILEDQFFSRYPLWDSSKGVNTQIVTFCKGAEFGD